MPNPPCKPIRLSLLVAFHERVAICLDAGDVSEAMAHRIATAECGLSLAELTPLP